MNPLDTGVLITCACVALSVFFATLVVVDFISYVSTRYKEKYLEETQTELEDIILQLPASRVLDLTLALSGLTGFLAAGIYVISARQFSWAVLFVVFLAGVIVSFPLPRFYLRFLRKRRLEKFNEQLEDALTSMSSALKAGFSINQALEIVAEENRRPISVEFRLLLHEIRLGLPLDKALDNMVKRMQSDDFELVATAITTARQTGGELTVIFERLSALIRERLRIHLRLRTLTAQGRIQAIIVGGMPIILLFAINYIAPEMMRDFLGSIQGLGLIALAIILDVVGFLFIKKILTIDV